MVLYDYQATADNGLNLRQGEIIVVHEKGSTGWWNGESSSGSGWFPESYVQKMVPPSPILHHLILLHFYFYPSYPATHDSWVVLITQSGGYWKK